MLIATALLAGTSCSTHWDNENFAESGGADSSSQRAGSSEYRISPLPTAPSSPGDLRCSRGNVAENFELPRVDVTNFPHDSNDFMQLLHREISEAGYESEPLDNLLFTYWNEDGKRLFYGTTESSRPIIKVGVRSVPNGTAFRLQAAAALVCVHPQQGSDVTLNAPSALRASEGAGETR